MQSAVQTPAQTLRGGGAALVRMACGLVLILAALTARAQAPLTPELLWRHATLYRDEWGTPHVYGDTPLTMAFAFGYAQAEDHLELMLLAYRVANGRAAEVGGEVFAESDEFNIKMGHAELAARAYPLADSLTTDLCEGFAMGVNAWMIAHPEQVPPWADGVRPEDILALLHCYNLSAAPFDLPGVYHMPTITPTGVAWAIGPNRSETGEPILVVSPHGYYDSPFKWYEAHLMTPDLNVYGATIYGLPALLIGHNGALGWGITPNQADTADIYLEREAPPQPPPNVVNVPPQQRFVNLRMLLAANPRTYYVRTAGGMEQRRTARLETPRGPLVGVREGTLCSYLAGGYGQFGLLSQLYAMAQAHDLTAFQAALGMMQLPPCHVVYADRDGNIFYLYHARTAVKQQFLLEIGPQGGLNASRPIDWRAPVPAGPSQYAWGAPIGLAELPSEVNPLSDYVQACGNPPWEVTQGSRIRPEDWPTWFATDRDSYRARRARHLLGLGVKTLEDCQAMLFDTLASMAQDAVPQIAGAAQNSGVRLDSLHPDLPAALDMLSKWPGTSSTDSEAMTLFHLWWSSMVSLAAKDAPSEDAIIQAIHAKAPALRELTLRALGDAVRLMRNEYGSINVPWGEAHVIRRGDREEPMPGAMTGEPLLAAGDRTVSGKKWIADYGPMFAMVVKFGAEPQGMSLVPFGASENPDSPHFSDQMDLLLEGRLKHAYFIEDEAIRRAKSAYGRAVRLMPMGMPGEFAIFSAVPATFHAASSPLPPMPLPGGLTNFTNYAELTSSDPPESLDVTMEIRVPPAVCAQDALEDLRIFAVSPDTGWEPLEDQQLNQQTGVFHGTDKSLRIYTVLGPAHLRRRPDRRSPGAAVPMPESMKASLEAEAKAARPKEKIPRRKPLAAPEAQEYTVLEFERGIPPAEAPSGSEIPQAPGESEASRLARGEERKGGLLRFFRRDKDGGAPERPPTSRETEAGHAPPQPSAVTREAAPASPLAAAPEPAARAQAEAPTAGGIVERPTVLRGAPSAAAAQPPAESQPAQQQGFGSGPAPIAVSRVSWGERFEARPPNMPGLFRVSSTQYKLQGRVSVYNQPPTPPPLGLVNYSPYFLLETSPPAIGIDIAMSLYVPGGVCAPETRGDLAIYAFSTQEGWKRLENQSLSGESGAFTAIDDRARLYAILGPAGKRLQAP